MKLTDILDSTTEEFKATLKVSKVRFGSFEKRVSSRFFLSVFKICENISFFEVIFMCASKIAMEIWYVGGKSEEIPLLIDLIFVITYAYTSHDRLSRLDDCPFEQNLFASIITRSAIALSLVAKNSYI